jgi:hypothetical protein
MTEVSPRQPGQERLTSVDKQTHDEQNFEDRQPELGFTKVLDTKDVLGVSLRSCQTRWYSRRRHS